jgi:hypothetical protein
MSDAGDIPQFLRDAALARSARRKEYDAQKDFAGSLDVAYDAIRKRVAAGGKGWTPK